MHRLELSAGAAVIRGVCWVTCYRVDADAFDPEAFRRRQLSVVLDFHGFVVPHVPALVHRDRMNCFNECLKT